MKILAAIAVALLLAGCVSDGANLSAATTSTPKDGATAKPAHDDNRERCFATSVGGQAENVCY